MATVDGAVVFKVLIDIFCLSVVSVPILIFKVAGEPFHRGFYCDDESLMHPHKPDTVPTWVASTVAIVLPLIFIVIVEGQQLSVFRRNCSCYSVVQSRPYLITLYRSIGSFFFGAAVTQVTTDVAKYTVGRLRPHFLTLCKPNIQNCTALTGYITADVCTGTDYAALKEARLSFPSGHTSITVYSMVFIIIYLQIKIKWRKSWLLRPFIQVVLFYMTYLTSLSRITDYMHHWSDVLGGAIIGLGVCLLVVFYISDFTNDPSCCKSGEADNTVPFYKSARQDDSDRLSMQTSTDSTSSTTSQGHIVNIPRLK